MEIKYSTDTQRIIDIQQEIQTGCMNDYGYTDISTENFQAMDIEILYFMVCLKPESPCYGTGTGAFVYKDGRVFKFHYNIHSPYSKGPHRSNTMTSIDELVLRDSYGIVSVDMKHTVFGSEAFHYYTPTNCLDDESRSMRELIKSIQTYCRKENLCGKLRRLDSFHEKWKESKQISIITVDSPNGTCRVVSNK